MDYTYFAVQRLKEFEAKKLAIKQIDDELRHLEASFTALSSVSHDKTVGKSGESSREQRLIDNIAWRTELENNKRITLWGIEITQRGVEALSKNERRILDMFYIRPQKDHIYRLCDELHVSQSELYRMKNNALRKFAIFCYGVVDI